MVSRAELDRRAALAHRGVEPIRVLTLVEHPVLNGSPVVFIHGPWLLPSSWDRWAEVFAAAGYTTLTPG